MQQQLMHLRSQWPCLNDVIHLHWPRVKTRLFYFSATTLLWSSISNPSDVIITISSSRKLWVFFMMFHWIQNSYQLSAWLNSCSQLLGAWSLAVEAQRWSQTPIEEIGASSQQANCMTTQLKLLSPAYHLWEPAHSKSLRWGFCSLNMLSLHHLWPSNWFSNVIVHCTYESWTIIINPSLHLSLFPMQAFPWHWNPALQQSFQVWLFLDLLGFELWTSSHVMKLGQIHKRIPTQSLMPASERRVTVSGTPSWSLSSTAAIPNST